MKMKNFKPVLVLSAICVAVALLLGLVNFATKDKIEDDQLAAEAAALTTVLDTTQEPKKINIPQGSNASVKELYEVEGIGYVVVVEGKGYNDTIKLTVGVIDGAVNKVVVTYDNETHGKSLKSLYESFIDLEKGDIDGVEKVTGASISSSAVKNLVKQALDCAIKAASGPVDETKGIYYNDAKNIISDAQLTKDELKDAPGGIIEAYSTADGRKVIVAKGNGYAAEITLAVGVNADGKIIKLVIVDQAETHGKDMAGFYDSFAGVDSGAIDSIEKVTKATYTSDFIKAIVKNAVAYALDREPEVPEEPVLDLAALVKELTGKDGKELSLSSTAPETLKALYKVDGGYVAYTVTSTQYVAKETEGLTWFDGEGKVIKSNLITWTVGHDIEPGDFANGFTDKANGDIGSVELVTGATGTAEHYRDAVKTASDYVVKTEAAKELPRTEEELEALVKEVVGGRNVSMTRLELKDAPETLRAIYKVAGGYVVYTVTSTQYVAVETEGIIYFGNSGNVIKANLVSWTVGHGIEPGEFANGFAGLENGNIGSVELVTGATGTAEHYRDAVKAASDYVMAILNAKIEEAVKSALGDDATVTNTESAPEEVIEAYEKANGEKLVIVKGAGYAGKGGVGKDVIIAVHVDEDGRVKGITMLADDETHGQDLSGFYDSFVGVEKNGVDGVEIVSGATVTSNAVKNLVKIAVEFATSGNLPRTEEELLALIKEITGEDAAAVDIKGAPDVLKALYKVSGGYVAYTVTSTQYVAVETEGLTWFDNNGKVIKSNLITWTVGHGVEPGDFANGFTDKENEAIGSVELVTGATGTAEHYRDAVKAASDHIVALADPLIKAIKEMTGLDAVKVELVDAPETLKALYKIEGGYVAYTITSTQYVAVETEGLTWFDNNGKIIRSTLITWTVGHGVEPGEFANGFEGLESDQIGSVDLVAGATGTAEHYRDAVKSAVNFATGIEAPEEPTEVELNDELVAGFVGGSVEPADDFAGAKFVDKIYTAGKKNYAVVISVETVDGAKAVEAIVLIKNGKIESIKLVNNFVDGVEGELSYEEMQNYLNSFVGKTIDDVAEVEVKGDSDTAKRIKRAVKASLRNLDKYLTEKAETEKAALYGKIDNVIGFILVAIALPAVPVIVIVTSKKEKRRGE